MKYPLLGLLVASSAAAETPTFVSLDRATGSANAGAHLGIMLFEDQDSDGGAPSLQQPRLQLFGEYAITPEVGVLASASVIWFRSDPVSDLGLGATYLGGYGRYAIAGVELIGRASIALPTTSFVPRDSYFEDVAIRGTLYPWLEERASDAGAWWLHTGATVRYRRGGVVAQLDGYLDVPLSGDVYDDMMSRGTPVRLHVGAGVAYAPEALRWRFGGEVVMSGYPWVSQLYGDLEADELTFWALTASATRHFEGGHDGVVWFSNSLNDYLRSRWHAIGVGYQRAL